MNIFELMDSKASSFSKTDKAIFESVKKFPKEYAYSSLNSLCDEGDSFSKSALTRFAQKLGFAGFMEFQYQFQQDLSTYTKMKTRVSNAEIYGRILRQVDENADRSHIKELIGRMKSANRVFIIGTNLSRLPAEELTIALSFEIGINAVCTSYDLLPYDYRDDDMIILYSAITGSSHQSLMKNLRREKQNHPYMVLITVNAKHPLRHNFNDVIVLPTASMSDSVSNTVLADTFAFLMFNDIFTSCLNNSEEN